MRRLICGFAGRTYHIVEIICRGSLLYTQKNNYTGSPLLAYRLFNKNLNKMENTTEQRFKRKETGPNDKIG